MVEEKFKDEYGILNLAMMPRPCGFCISFLAFFYIYDRSKYFLLKNLRSSDYHLLAQSQQFQDETLLMATDKKLFKFK